MRISHTSVNFIDILHIKTVFLSLDTEYLLREYFRAVRNIEERDRVFIQGEDFYKISFARFMGGELPFYLSNDYT